MGPSPSMTTAQPHHGDDAIARSLARSQWTRSCAPRVTPPATVPQVNVVFPNKQSQDPLKMYKGHLLDSEVCSQHDTIEG